MCGIAGIVETNATDPSARLRQVARMREALGHRGPDSWGMAELSNRTIARHSAAGVSTVDRGAREPSASAWLGHQRLAIIDLSDRASQPMCSADGSGWLVFNGEIYNFRELQRRFSAAPASNSDAAVLLELLVTRGIDALLHLRGMFAFAFWSEREQALYLVRDRFGIKPLYWTVSKGAVAFASEPRALRAAGFGNGLRRDAEAVFLRRGHVPADESSIDGLKVVPPGFWLRFDAHGLQSGCWYDARLFLGHGVQSATEAAARLQEALDDSVRAHLVSDVPTGVFLSGGLDSAAIVASAARIGASQLRTFTIVIPGTSIDESEPAARIARHFGAEHTEVPIQREEVAGWIEEALEAMPEPTIDGLNTFIVSRAVRRAGLKVVLSGLGGDEVLGGYPSFVDVPRLWTWLAPFRAGVPGRSLAAAAAGLAPVAAPGKLAEMVREPARTRAGLWRQYRSLFERDDVRGITGRDAPPDDRHDVERQDSHRSFLDIIMLCEIHEFMIPQLLRDADTFSMCDGLELRVPFVDHHVLFHVHQRGWWNRGAHATHKAAVLAAMPDPLPSDHLSRPKTGFVLPVDEWLRAALAGSTALRILHEPLRAPELRSHVDAFQSGRLSAARLWALVVRRRFLQKYATA